MARKGLRQVRGALFIRGMSEKYSTCVGAILRHPDCGIFEVVPIWLNHTLPAVLPHLKAVLERRFWNGLQLARCITLNHFDVDEPLSSERHRGEEASQRLTRNAVVFFSRHHAIFQNFNVIFFVDRLTSWSKFVVHNTLTIEKSNQHWHEMAPTLTCFIRPFLNRLYHSFICVMPILSSTKTFCIISIISVQLLPRLKKNLMQIRWSVLSVIFNCKQMRRTEEARWTKTHAAPDLRHPAGNYGIQGVREGLLVTQVGYFSDTPRIFSTVGPLI